MGGELKNILSCGGSSVVLKYGVVELMTGRRDAVSGVFGSREVQGCGGGAVLDKIYLKKNI